MSEEPPDGPEQLLDRERLDGQAESGGEARRHAVPRRVRERGELGLHLCRGVVVDDAGKAFDSLPHRPERDALSVGEAPAGRRERPRPGRREEL